MMPSSELHAHNYSWAAPAQARLCHSRGGWVCRSGVGTRVLMVTSCTYTGGELHFDDLQAKRSYHPLLQYTASKLANVLAAGEFQRRFDR